jgi:hypothetical protein
MGVKQQRFTLDFGEEGIEYSCQAEIHGIIRSPRLEVECRSRGDDKMSFRCEETSKVETTFGSVKLKGNQCELDAFELKKKLNPKDPGLLEEDGKYYFGQSEKDKAAIARRIEEAVARETFVFKNQGQGGPDPRDGESRREIIEGFA